MLKGIKGGPLLINEQSNKVKREQIRKEYSDFEKKSTPVSDKETNATLNKHKDSLTEIEEEYDSVSDEEYNLYSPIAVNFPDKINPIKCITKNETYGIIPSLNLSKTNNPNYRLHEKKTVKAKTSRLTKIIKQLNNEEWRLALKHSGMNDDELIKLSRNKLLKKVFEVILNLNRIIEEKSALLHSSINKLILVTEERNKKEQENREMYTKLIEMRSEVEKLILANSKHTAKQLKRGESMLVNAAIEEKDLKEITEEDAYTAKDDS